MTGPYDLPDRPAITPTGLPAGPDVTQPIELVPDDNLLVTAAKLLRQRGRCRERLIDDTGCMCPVGALAVAAGADPDVMLAWENEEADEETPAVYEPVNSLPETAHLARVIVDSGDENAHYCRSTAPVHTVWYWADRSDDAHVLELLDRAADSYQRPAVA